MLKSKLFLILLLFCVPLIAFAGEELLRIGGLDITTSNYGTIRIGPHENADSSGARFANYYFDLSTWVSADLNGESMLSDGDVTSAKSLPDWRLYQQTKLETISESMRKYATVYRDDQEREKHQPLGIEITQEIYCPKALDWAIMSMRVKNISQSDMKNLLIGLRLDADVPDENNYPTANDDMIGRSGNLLYLYDHEQTPEKSNIVGLLPLGENIAFSFNWWNIDSDPVTDLQRNQLQPANKSNLPATPSDYRILVTQGTFDLKQRQELDIVFAIIESKGLNQAEKAVEEAKVYFESNIAPGLKKMEQLAESNSTDKLPEDYDLFQNYPNPFNPATTISYSLPENDYVEIKIYNIKGEMITTLLNQPQKAGNHQVVWNGCDESGNRVSNGVYYYQIKTDRFTMTKKMVLLR